MSAIFFKRIAVFISAVWVIFVLCATMFRGNARQAVLRERTVYFLVYPTESVEASSGEISLRGGAGYPYLDGMVAFGVYLDLEKGEEALRSVALEYPSASLMVKVVSWNLGECWEAVYGCLSVLDGWIEALENGARQSVVKAGITETSKTLDYIRRVYDEVLLEELSAGLVEAADGVLYASDLRWLLCLGCDKLSA